MNLKTVIMLGGMVACLGGATAYADYHVSFDFDSSWSGDYAPGWENTSYRHGAPPVGKMMEYEAGGFTGGGMRLIADSTPESWMWWAAVNPSNINYVAMQKQYNPWVSVMYYDQGWATEDSYNPDLHKAGQLFAVPSWVNPYIAPGEDWTDIQFGARMNQAPPADNYYYVAAGENGPGWQDTGVDRTTGWHQLKMQLSSVDGRVHFYIDGTEVGQSYRNDYIDLGDVGLYTMFTDPLSDWTHGKPSTIWDNFEFGSSVPAPAPVLLVMIGVGLVGWIKRRVA